MIKRYLFLVVCSVTFCISSLQAMLSQAYEKLRYPDILPPATHYEFNIQTFENIGNRDRQEDFIIKTEDKNIKVVGVCDGHTQQGVDYAKHIAQYCADEIPLSIIDATKKPSWTQWLGYLYTKKAPTISESIQKAIDIFEKKQEKLNTGYHCFTPLGRFGSKIQWWNDIGTTLAMVIPSGDKLHCVHIGDSRIIVFNKNNEILYASQDHKPNREDEKKRIESTGCKITQHASNHGSYYRINSLNGLSVSRAIGDWKDKQCGINSTPEITTVNLGEVGTIVLCTDGVLDYLDYDDQHNKLSENNTIQKFVINNTFDNDIARKLVLLAAKKEAEIKASKDNGSFSEISDQNKLTDDEILYEAHDNQTAVMIKVNKK